MVATKRAPADANTTYAQGGVAGVLDPDDSFDAHVEDTLRVGDGLCHREIVEICAREGPEHILWLANELGVPFDRDAAGHLELGREGGHTARRIVHAKDTTGCAIQEALLGGVAKRADRITLLPDHLAVDLLTTAKYGGPNAVFGAYLLDQRTGRGRDRHRARHRARDRRLRQGLPLHHEPRRRDRRRHRDGLPGRRARRQHGVLPVPPDVLYHPPAKSFLISEALRGEGGILRLRDGTAFMQRYHEMKELAPRDIVARAIDAEIKRTGDDHVDLDMTHLPGDFVTERFPNIHAAAWSWGSTCASSRSRSCRRRTTAAAACWSTSTGARRCATSTPSARCR